MSGDEGRTRPAAWLPVRVPPRARLVAVVVCLLAAAAGIIVPAGLLAARASLARQADQQVRAYARFLASHPVTVTPVFRFPPGGFAPRAPGRDLFGLEVLGPAGLPVVSSGPGTWPALPRAARVPSGTGRPVTVPAGRGGGKWLMIAEPVRWRARRIPFAYGAGAFSVRVTGRALHQPGQAGTLLVGLDLSRSEQALGRLARTALAVSGAVILAAGVLAAITTRAILAQAAQGRRTPPARAATARGAGLPGRLAGVAGELRTPLSVIRGSAEYYRLHRPLGPREADRMMQRVAEEAGRLGALIDDLPAAGRRGPGPAGRPGHGPAGREDPGGAGR